MIPRPDAIVAALASRSQGVITRKALLAAGLTVDQIRGRTENGMLHAVHPGVYRVGHVAPNQDATYLAAVVACGPRAVLGGLAAAWQYGAARGRAPAAEVVAPGAHRLPGVVCRRGQLVAADRAVWRGIPTVTVPRMLVEIAGRLDAEVLARACHECGVRYRTTPSQVSAASSRWPKAPGAAKLRAVMGGEVMVSLSVLERRFLSLLRSHSLALPLTNRPAGGFRVDCRWPAHRLTVELDSYRFHNSRQAWERDRQREREAYARGDQFRRYTWRDVMEDPAAMLRELTALLGKIVT